MKLTGQITPMKFHIPNTVRYALSVSAEDFNSSVKDDAVKLWALTKLLPDAPSGELLGLVKGENTIAYSEDGDTVTISRIKG